MADDSTRTLANGAKLVGEAVLPGASLLMDGKIGEGAVHAIVGVGARVVLGPIGWLGSILVAADSFSKSVADRNLWDYVPREEDAPEAGAAREPAAGKPGRPS